MPLNSGGIGALLSDMNRIDPIDTLGNLVSLILLQIITMPDSTTVYTFAKNKIIYVPTAIFAKSGPLLAQAKSRIVIFKPDIIENRGVQLLGPRTFSCYSGSLSQATLAGIPFGMWYGKGSDRDAQLLSIRVFSIFLWP